MAMANIADEIYELINKNKGEAPKSEEPEIEQPEVELVETEWEDRDGEGVRFVKFVKWSTLTGRDPKDLHVPDHLQAIFKGYDSPPLDPDYVYDWETMDWFAFSVANKLKSYLVGPTGCGKTKMPHQFAAMTGRPFLRIDHTEELDRALVFGQIHISPTEDGGTSTDFVPGMLIDSAYGPTIVDLDEVEKATAAAAFIYKRLLDRGEMYVPEMKEAGKRAITPDEHWSLCGTANTKGDGEDMDKYPSCNVQDAAFRNSWEVLLEVDYLDEQSEISFIEKLSPTMDPMDVGWLASFSSLIHTGFKTGELSTAFSMRQIKTICTMFNAGVGLKCGIRKGYVDFCSKSELPDVIETARSVFGTYD